MVAKFEFVNLESLVVMVGIVEDQKSAMVEVEWNFSLLVVPLLFSLVPNKYH